MSHTPAVAFTFRPRMHEPLQLGHRPLIVHDPTQNDTDMISGLSLLVRESMNWVPSLGGVKQPKRPQRQLWL